MSLCPRFYLSVSLCKWTEGRQCMQMDRWVVRGSSRCLRWPLVPPFIEPLASTQRHGAATNIKYTCLPLNARGHFISPLAIFFLKNIVKKNCLALNFINHRWGEKSGKGLFFFFKESGASLHLAAAVYAKSDNKPWTALCNKRPGCFFGRGICLSHRPQPCGKPSLPPIRP